MHFSLQWINEFWKYMKKVKNRLFKKYLKTRKSRSRFCFPFVDYISVETNNLKLEFCWCRSSKSRKNISFCPTLILIFLVFGEREKGKLNFEKGWLVDLRTYVMLCAIWYHVHNLKYVKNIHGVLLLVTL